MPLSDSGLDYQITIRDSNFLLLGMLDDYESLDYTGRFNDVGEWVIVVSKASPNASLLVRGNGIVVTDVAHGQVIFSGPIRTVTRTGTNQAQNLTVAGWDDMVWLKRRLAWPITGGQIYYQFLKTFGSQLIRWYRMGDLSGTTCVDLGTDLKNGTYTNGPTLNQPGAVYYDTNPSVLFNDGASQYVACPTGAGIPTGNSSWTIRARIYMTSFPSGNAFIASWGTNAAHKFGGIYITSAGLARATTNTTGSDTAGGSALSLNAWHEVVGTWDGTTIKCFVDGVAYGTTGTPGAMTTNASPPFFIGAHPAITFFFHGQIGEVQLYNGPISTGIAAQYAIAAQGSGDGLNQQAFDTQTSAVASTAIYHYVNNNLGPGAQLDRWPGQITNYVRAPLTMAADPVIGTSIGAVSRFDNLLLLCQVLALAGGDLGLKIIQSTVGGSVSGALTFSIFQPVNRTNIILEEAAGTLGQYTFVQDESTDNFCVVAGSGALTARVLSAQSDATSLAIFGRIEGLLNASSTADIPTLNALALDEVTKNANDHTVTATPVEVTHMVYGVDYNLGDKVTVIVDGVVTTDIIRECALSLNPTDGAFWVPTIGSPSAKSANDELKDLYKSIKRAGTKIQFLDAVQ